MQDRAGGSGGPVLFSNVILILDFQPGVNEMPGERVIFIFERKNNKDFQSALAGLWALRGGREDGPGTQIIAFRKTWLGFLLKHE